MPHDDGANPTDGKVPIATMHLTKELEFRSVAVCRRGQRCCPESRIESITDEADLEEVYNTERHLFYVACTRARDDLLVSAEQPGSEFLDDLRPAKA